MISFQFETYIADGAEHYSYGADYGKGMVQTSKTVSFPESLLSLIDMNIDEIEPAAQRGTLAAYDNTGETVCRGSKRTVG